MGVSMTPWGYPQLARWFLKKGTSHRSKWMKTVRGSPMTQETSLNRYQSYQIVHRGDISWTHPGQGIWPRLTWRTWRKRWETTTGAEHGHDTTGRTELWNLVNFRWIFHGLSVQDLATPENRWAPVLTITLCLDAIIYYHYPKCCRQNILRSPGPLIFNFI